MSDVTQLLVVGKIAEAVLAVSAKNV